MCKEKQDPQPLTEEDLLLGAEDMSWLEDEDAKPADHKITFEEFLSWIDRTFQ